MPKPDPKPKKSIRGARSSKATSGSNIKEKYGAKIRQSEKEKAASSMKAHVPKRAVKKIAVKKVDVEVKTLTLEKSVSKVGKQSAAAKKNMDALLNKYKK